MKLAELFGPSGNQLNKKQKKMFRVNCSMFFKGKKKPIKIGIGIVIVLAVIGTVGALNGYFGGGGHIPQDTFTRGLVGYWNFDEGTGSIAHDISGHENHGQICGLPFIDSRDGKTYATVHIGTQCWMAENLNIGTRIDGANQQDNDSVIQKYCYDNLDARCDTDGGLYQWAQALDLPYTCNSTSTCTINDPHQGICPDGWHIPSDQDWYDLTDYLSANSQYWCGGNSTQIAKSLATTDDVEPNWTNSATACHVGNDRSTNNLTGFSVLPAGGRRAGGSFYDRSSLSGLWSASQGTATSAWRRRLTYGNATVYRGSGDKAYGFSVRCLRE